MDDSTITLWGLFFSAFISSTLFPGGSEIVLGVLTQQQNHSTWLLLCVATIGNTLGGISTWLIGRLAARRLKSMQSFADKHQRAITRLRRHGSPALLLSWLPIIGDPLCFAAGWLGIGLVQSSVMILLGKAARYAVLVALV